MTFLPFWLRLFLLVCAAQGTTFCSFGGVGSNFTPPKALNDEQISSIQNRISQFANHLGLNGYARIDVYYHMTADDLYLIEVNTLPGLSSATVTYTQALVTPGVELQPQFFLDRIISHSIEKG